jgi:hypothetical protein
MGLFALYTDDQVRSALDYSAEDFLDASWNDTYFVPRSIQKVEFDPLLPSNQFPRDFYDGNFLVPAESMQWMKDNMPNSGLALFWPNHPGITMEGYQLMDVRA